MPPQLAGVSRLGRSWPLVCPPSIRGGLDESGVCRRRRMGMAELIRHSERPVFAACPTSSRIDKGRLCRRRRRVCARPSNPFICLQAFRASERASEREREDEGALRLSWRSSWGRNHKFQRLIIIVIYCYWLFCYFKLNMLDSQIQVCPASCYCASHSLASRLTFGWIRPAQPSFQLTKTIFRNSRRRQSPSNPLAYGARQMAL